MIRAAWIAMFAIAVAVGCHEVEPINHVSSGHGSSSGIGGAGGAGGGGEGGGHDCDDLNPCTDDSRVDGGCAHVVRDAGSICYGSVTEPVHGECVGDVATCDITDWTCPHGEPGDKCNNGTGVCAKNRVCCSGGCIDDTGFCMFGPPYGGAPCHVP